MRADRLLVLFLGLLLTGCSLPSQSLWTPVTFREALTTVEDGRERRVKFTGFEEIKDQVEGNVPRRERRGAALDGLPQDLADCSLMEKVVECVGECLYGERAEVILDADAGDYEEFAEVMSETLTDIVDGTVERKGKSNPLEKPSSFSRRWFYYLNAYTRGKFIDRSGGRLAKPRVSLEGAPNDTITGLATVTLEAVFDHAFSLPVYYSMTESFEPEYVRIDPRKMESDDVGQIQISHGDDRYQQVFRRVEVRDYHTVAGNVPTAVEFDQNSRKLARRGTRGISRNELEAIHFVSNLSGEQSKSLTGLVLRFFADVEVAFLIGGHFAVGDNETLACLAEAVVECSARRATEAAAYRFFEGYSGELPESVESILDVVEDERR